MNSNWSLVDRRSMAPSTCRQLGVPPPPAYSHHPPPDALASTPFLFYPTNIDPAYGPVFPYIPFPGHFGVYDCPFEPAFIQKRNERERQRVKCVNEGYARLRGHLPGALSEKRLSKVETLRAAIKYIKYLQDSLSRSSEGAAAESMGSSLKGGATPRISCGVKLDCGSDGESKVSRASSSEPPSSSSPSCESEECSRRGL
ncbi:achaete-scute homolog 5 [Rhinatrema bivittatum]|uniref:achaete-scute homolog 5 n=1 Tax=Rhinatrema bivittatum TaxID=194408 RepID=UPI001125DC36|nr:achaete-scute homolog 5 [Rhinatrema bivittatum]